MAQKKMTKMSPAEMVILAMVWELGQATVQEVYLKLSAKKQTAYSTVQTLLRRLENKGYLKHRIQGKAHQYYACVKKDVVVSRAVNDFVNRLFGGDPIPLLIHMAEKGNIKKGSINSEDLEKLKELVDKTNS